MNHHPLWTRWGSLLFRIALLCSSFVWATGCFDSCAPPFPPSNQIDKFRVLAVQADPPELTPGDSTQVRFLAVNEKGLVQPDNFPGIDKCLQDGGPADPSAFWIACLPGVDSDQQVDNFCGRFPGFGVSGLDGGTVGSDGGNSDLFADGGFNSERFQLFLPPCGPTATWTSPSNYLDPLSADEQTKGVAIVAVLATLFQGQQQVTLKRLRLSTRPKSEQNTNPALTGMLVNGQTVQSCRPSAPDRCKLVTVPAQKLVAMQAVLNPMRQDLLPPGEGKANQKEDIVIEWFATQGSFDLRRTVRSGEDPPQHSPWPQWRPYDFKGKPLPPGQEVQIIGIARDLRGGTDWISLRLVLGPPAPDAPTND